MRSHVKYVLPNLEWLVGSWKADHGGVLEGFEPNTSALVYTYLVKGDCANMGLIALDEIAREFGVSIARFFLPLDEPTPRDKYYACCFSNNLKYYKKLIGKSSVTVTRDMKLTSSAVIRNYEIFKAVPHLDNLQRIAESLGVEVIELFKLNKDKWKEGGIIE